MNSELEAEQITIEKMESGNEQLFGQVPEHTDQVCW